MKILELNEFMKLELELNVAHLCRHFSSQKEGNMFIFDDEGQYWFPACSSLELTNEYNYSSEKFLPRSAGVALSLMAASHLSFKHYEKNESLSMNWGEYYYSLRDYVLSSFHDVELRKIFEFLD